MRCYRIISDKYLGYEVQVKKRFLFWTWWKQCKQLDGMVSTNTFSTLESAKEWIDDGLPKRKMDEEEINVLWITEGCK